MSPHRKDFKRRRKSKFKYYRRYTAATRKGTTARLLLSLPMMKPSVGSDGNNTNISFKLTPPSPPTAISSCIIVANGSGTMDKHTQITSATETTSKVEQFQPFPVSFPSTAASDGNSNVTAFTSTVFPLEGMPKWKKQQRRMLNVAVTKDKVKVAHSSFSFCSNKNMVATTGKHQQRRQQSPPSILVPSASDGSGSHRLMSQQPNEYYFKYSRVCSTSRRNGGAEPYAFSRCLCRRCQRQHSFRRTIITNDLQKMKRGRQLLVKLKMGQDKQQQYEQPFNSDGCKRQTNNSQTCCCYPRAICSNLDSCKSCNDNHTTCSREGGGYYCHCCSGSTDKSRFGSCSSISYRDDSADSRITNMIQDFSNGLSQTYSSILSAITTTTTTSASTIYNTTTAKPSSSSLSSPFSTSFSHSQESFSSKFPMCNTILPSLSSSPCDEDTANKMSLPKRDLLSQPQNTSSSTVSSSSCMLPINTRWFLAFPTKLVHVLLSFLTLIVTSFWDKVNMKYTVLNNTLIKLPAKLSLFAYFVKSQRHLSSSVRGNSRVTTPGTNGITTPTITTKSKNSSVISGGGGGAAGHRFRSCQITREKSDLIYIIAVGLCLLSPSVTPVITSNAIFPMDSAAHADRDMDGELSILVEGVVGKRVEMPCDITPSRRDDTVYMVLWFRGEESIPIYSLDVRGKHVGGGKPWSAERPFGKRAYFQSTSEPARLIVESAKTSDQGIYRCRVDFRNSPSREARLNLTITVPPNEPQIYDSTGMSIRGEVGPYLEGSNVELTCIVRDGVPSPMVQWYLNDELVDSSYHVKNDKEVINHIPVSNIQRSHHRASLSCRASNTLLVPPVTKTVYFELNLRPLSVSIPIKHRNPQLTADTQYEIKCESWGSHPPPVMTWWLDGREEKGAAIEESRGSNNSVSRLFFTPNASNDGQVLTCRAENPHVTAGALEDSWRLRVVYPPMLSLRMGSSLNPRDIKEGDDVYFECHIRANPQVHKLAWFHNGFLLHHNRSAGVILSNQSLVLQKVSRPSAGNYSCRASNVQGEGTSNHVLLDIMYAPACQQTDLSGTDAPIIIAASRSEDVNITCEMDALPDRLKFQWTHTNTVGENAELEPDMYTSVGSKSLLRYHLRSEEDFGTLLCWAHNSIGQAERPCVYQLVPADVPQPVENCSIINRTSTSVEITCEPGFDGGLPQSFLLEAYQTHPAERRGILYNLTLDKPTFSLSRLDTEGTFHFKIYSVNRKGRGIPSIMDGIVLRYPAMQSAKTRDLEKTTIAIIIGAGSAILLGVVSLIAFIIHRIRHPISAGEMEKSYSREFGSTHRGSANGNELYRNDSTKKPGNPGMEIPFTATSDFDEDGDPDLIPTSKNVKAAAMGSVYSRLSNGEINQRYVAGPTEKIPLRPMDPDLPISSMPPPCPIGPMDDPYTQGLPNYATFRGKPNGLGLKQRQQQQPRPMVSSSSTSFHGKSSTIVVNIDTRLIGQQLASNQLPESCV